MEVAVRDAPTETVSGDKALMEWIQYTFDTMKTLLTVAEMY